MWISQGLFCATNKCQDQKCPAPTDEPPRTYERSNNLNGIWNWIVDNWEVLFSGAGGAFVIFVLGVIRKKRNANSQKIQSGSGSTNVQAGRDVKLKFRSGDRNVEED